MGGFVGRTLVLFRGGESSNLILLNYDLLKYGLANCSFTIKSQKRST